MGKLLVFRIPNFSVIWKCLGPVWGSYSTTLRIKAFNTRKSVTHDNNNDGKRGKASQEGWWANKRTFQAFKTLWSLRFSSGILWHNPVIANKILFEINQELNVKPSPCATTSFQSFLPIFPICNSNISLLHCCVPPRSSTSFMIEILHTLLVSGLAIKNAFCTKNDFLPLHRHLGSIGGAP